jgi:AcrR family transcriptional regulator
MADGDTTRDRIVIAATAEFAEHGIAGARIERIARAARTSKERVYAYFRGKDELYRYVAAHELKTLATAVPFDPANLPEYAVRLHDHALAHPQRMRLMKWGQMEPSSSGTQADDPFGSIVGDKVDRVRQAQRDGLLDRAWDPRDVLVFVSQLATSWSEQADLLPAGDERTEFLAARRQAIRAAVERLFPAVAR